MEQGLASMMVYGNGEGQNTKHHYAGTLDKKPTKRKKKVSRDIVCVNKGK